MSAGLRGVRRLDGFGGLGGGRYVDRVLGTRRAELLAYWPLGEASGAVANDLSGAGRHGAYTGVELGQPGIGDGRTSPLFDGANDFVNVYSASLAGAFNGAEGTLMVWGRVAGAGVLTDGLGRRMVRLEVNGQNLVSISKTTVNNQCQLSYLAGGTLQTILSVSMTAAWQHWAITWSKAGDAVKAYLNGVQLDVTKTGLGVWAGALAPATTLVGASTTAPLMVWLGTLAHPALWDVALSVGEIAALGKV